MKNRPRFVGACLQLIARHFLWLLIGTYAIAAMWPTFGLWIRAVTLGEVTVQKHKINLSLPVVMLSFLLLNAGLGVKVAQLRDLIRKPLVLLSGLTSNLVVPVAFIGCIARIMNHWLAPEEVQVMILGLALVAAMPIAGSSTAWSQNANGDMALSLALMLFSTFLSPITTPFTFDLLERMTHEEYAVALCDLGSQGSGVLFWVLVPALAGIVGRRMLGEKRIEAVKPKLKLLNYVNLLILNYSNASVSLPQTMANPDWHFLSTILGIVLCLCVTAFGSGWLLACVFKLNRSQQISLMFGLGMNNNGTGLVLASLVLAEYPRAMLPLLFYNLVQHLVAGCVNFHLSRSAPERAVMLAKARA